jgi:hypothetical protein
MHYKRLGTPKYLEYFDSGPPRTMPHIVTLTNHAYKSFSNSIIVQIDAAAAILHAGQLHVHD